MSEGLAERKAARGRYMSTEHPVIAWSSEIGIANFQIGSVFINKPQIWVLNNYILAWKTLKTTFHDTITVIFWKLHGFLGNDVSQVTRTHIEKRLLSVWKYKSRKYTVIFVRVCALWCHKQNTAEQNEWRRSFIPLYHAQVTILVNQSTSAVSLAPPFWYPLLCSVPQRKGTKKVVQYGSLFWYHSQLLKMEMDIIAYRTILYRTVPLSGNEPIDSSLLHMNCTRDAALTHSYS